MATDEEHRMMEAVLHVTTSVLETTLRNHLSMVHGMTKTEVDSAILLMRQDLMAHVTKEIAKTLNERGR